MECGGDVVWCSRSTVHSLCTLTSSTPGAMHPTGTHHSQPTSSVGCGACSHRQQRHLILTPPHLLILTHFTTSLSVSPQCHLSSQLTSILTKCQHHMEWSLHQQSSDTAPIVRCYIVTAPPPAALRRSSSVFIACCSRSCILRPEAQKTGRC